MATTKQSKSSYDDGATARTVKDTGLQTGEQFRIVKLQEWTAGRECDSLKLSAVYTTWSQEVTAKLEPPTTSK